MSSRQLIFNYYSVEPTEKSVRLRRTLISFGKLIAEFVLLSILALAVVWVGSTLVAAH